MAESPRRFALHLLKKKQKKKQQQLVMMATPATTLMTPCGAPYSTTASYSTSVEERLSLSLSHLLAHKITIITRSKIREIATSSKQSSQESRIASLILCCCSRRHSRALTGTRTLEDHASWRSKHRLVDPATQ